MSNITNWYRTAVKQLEMPLKLPNIKFPTSKLPPDSDWHSARVINQIIRDNPDEVRNYQALDNNENHTDAQRLKVGLQMYKEELENRYAEILEKLKNLPNPVPVYRAINVEAGRTLESVKYAIDTHAFGIFWSWREDGAEAHWGGKGRTITLYAYAPHHIVDWRSSLELNVYCPDEIELRLFPGRDILIYKIIDNDQENNVSLRGKT